MKRFERVKIFLEEAVGGQTIGAHRNFWRGLSLEEFKQKKVFGIPLLIVGNADDSNLIKALEGRDPFGSDIGTPDAIFPRMPDGFPPVPAERIDYLRKWIADGCPDDEETAPPSPARHNDYWRDFDNWSMFEAKPEIEEAIGEFFDRVPVWWAAAGDPAHLPDWTNAISEGPAQAAIGLLSTRILDSVHSHYGSPINLDDLLESYELFGADRLPEDPLRPDAPRHNMNSPIMWFFYTAMVDAKLRISSAPAAQEWEFMARAVLIGLLNDGLFRDRFNVVGFSPDAAGTQAIRSFVRSLANADLLPELAKRFVDSQLVVPDPVATTEDRPSLARIARNIETF
jgi:hypothetical protein